MLILISVNINCIKVILFKLVVIKLYINHNINNLVENFKKNFKFVNINSNKIKKKNIFKLLLLSILI